MKNFKMDMYAAMHSVVGTVVLTTPLTTPLDPDNCRQIHMWRFCGFPLGSPHEVGNFDGV